MQLLLNCLLILSFHWTPTEAVLCELWEALKDPNNPSVDRTCGAGNPCPANYMCHPSRSICCPDKSYICSLPMQAGAACGATAYQCQKWYYNPTFRQCTQFTYLGCFGNLNNFNSRYECEYHCRQTTQPQGQYCQTGSTQQSTTPCTSQAQCLAGYQCIPSPTWPTVSYCCSTTTTTPTPTPQQLCPGGLASLVPTTECNPLQSTCQQGYSCLSSPTQVTRFYCCTTPSTSQFCSTGYDLQPGITNINQFCDPPVFVCRQEQGYTCMPSTVLQGRSYCCRQRQRTTVLCQEGSPVFIPGTNTLMSCYNGQKCPTPYVCQSSGTVVNEQQLGICCSTDRAQDCPNGLQPFRMKPAGNYLYCSNMVRCPFGGQCLPSLNPILRGSYICCIARRSWRTRSKKIDAASNDTELVIMEPSNYTETATDVATLIPETTSLMNETIIE